MQQIISFCLSLGGHLPSTDSMTRKVKQKAVKLLLCPNLLKLNYYCADYVEKMTCVNLDDIEQSTRLITVEQIGMLYS